MATQKQKLGAAVVDLTAAFSLTVGNRYQIQVQGGDARVAESATAPDPTDVDAAFRKYGDKGSFPYKAAAAVTLYGWGAGRLICDDA